MKLRVTRRAFLQGGAFLGLGSSAFVLFRSWQASSSWPAFRRRFSALGTQIQLTIYNTPTSLAVAASEAAFREMATIHRLMSTHDPHSQLSQVNRRAGRTAMEVDSRVIEVVRESLKWSRLSKGVFDPTILPLLKTWGFRDYRFDRSPDEFRLRRALDRVGWQRVRLEGNSLGLEKAGTELDAGGVAKGYAVDRAVDILRSYGISQALVEAGGDLFAMGRPPDQGSWTIGIRHPDQKTLCALLEIENKAVATSGTYFSYRQYGGKRYGHLIDPRTGEPIDTYLSTTVTASKAVEADALSTTLFTAGRGAGLPATQTSAGWLHIGATEQGSLTFQASDGFPVWRPMEG